MRQTATDIVTKAAMTAGLPGKAIMIEAEKDSVTLPKRRVEIGFLTESYKYTGRPVRKRPSKVNAKTHRTFTRERHSIRLPVRVVIRSDDEGWLKEFSRRFLAALPKRTVDGDGNSVTVAVEKAKYGGFTKKAVEVIKKRSKTYHIALTGMTTADTEIPLIKSVRFDPKYREASNEQTED